MTTLADVSAAIKSDSGVFLDRLHNINKQILERMTDPVTSEADRKVLENLIAHDMELEKSVTKTVDLIGKFESLFIDPKSLLVDNRVVGPVKPMSNCVTAGMFRA